jgi:hypothetical protein
VLSPSDLAALEQKGRVADAVEEWVESVEFQIQGNSRPGGYADVEATLTNLRDVIAKAKEVEPRG